MPAIATSLAQVRDKIAAAAARAGRGVESVTLVAVSKMHPAESIAEALDSGQTLFGESRVQEAKLKIPLLPARARWHFIGHLQKNKVRAALPLFELLHGVDTLALAQEVDRIAAEEGVFPRVLIEVNVAGESTKFGFEPAALKRDFEALLKLERLQIEGLMIIAPYADEAEASREFFVKLRTLQDELQTEFRVPLPQLSMGMSGDYEVAIEEGATLVRVGTAIFGQRSGRALKASEGFDS